MNQRVATGLDILRDGYWGRLKGHRLGLLTNQASVDARLRPARRIIAEVLPGQLKALFGPQHGHQGEDQDNMVETDHAVDRELNIPVFSLYSGVREPTVEMLGRLDTLIVDLQDVGTRVYTFASTMLNCLRAASQYGKKVVILDRPNPLGGQLVEGNLLKPDLHSFVGPFRLPMRHGLTMAEMALVFNQELKLGCDLEIVKMESWRREMRWEHTGLRWIMPSPNMPLPETAHVYPGQVVWEGTNLSEGRGTCRPFEIFGAGFLDPPRIKERLHPEASAGCHLQEIAFRPTFHKWQGRLCRGFMIHVIDHRAFRPYFMTIALLGAILQIHRDQFEWKDPPYEYEYERLPIDLILGDTALRRSLEAGDDISRKRKEWELELQEYSEWRKPYLLYE